MSERARKYVSSQFNELVVPGAGLVPGCRCRCPFWQVRQRPWIMPRIGMSLRLRAFAEDFAASQKPSPYKFILSQQTARPSDTTGGSSECRCKLRNQSAIALLAQTGSSWGRS